MEYAMFKNGVSAIPELQSFIQLLEVLPVSSADCERGFSQMNIYHTSGRNRLLVQSVSDMLIYDWCKWTSSLSMECQIIRNFMAEVRKTWCFGQSNRTAKDMRNSAAQLETVCMTLNVICGLW